MIPRFDYTVSAKHIVSGTLKYLVSKSKLKAFFPKPESFSGIVYGNSARTLLYCLLKGISGNQKLKVGVQAYNCHSVFEAVKSAGHDIIFVDIDESFRIDISDLKSKSQKIDVLVITNTFGFLNNIKEIKTALGNKLLIEDGAHSFRETKYDEVPEYDAMVYSFGLGKFPSIGEGGICRIQNKSRFVNFDSNYNALQSRSNLGNLIFVLKYFVRMVLFSKIVYSCFTFPLLKKADKQFDFNKKFGLSKKRTLDVIPFIFESFMGDYAEYIQKLKNNYTKLFGCLSNLSFDINVQSSYYIFPILISEYREEKYVHLLKNGIECGRHFSDCLKWAASFGYNQGDCPKTEKIVKEILTIPCHLKMSENELKKISKNMMKIL